MARKHFGTDGIGGEANSVITPGLAMKVAQATGVLFQRGEHRHPAVIGRGLERYLEGIGLTLARTAVGDRYVLEHMRQNGFNLGGEQSGHIIFSDYCTKGDGLVTALQLLSVIKRESKPVSQVCHRFEPSPQVLKSVKVGAGKPLEDAEVVRAIDSGRKTLGVAGRLVIRASGTEPVIRVMGEGDNLDLVERIVDEVCGTLAAFARAS